jgi:hypothetical protein
METKDVYGWTTATDLKVDGTFTTDTNNIDTHLMKNIEYGVITYLSKSKYGKETEEIWINNANNYTTGCAGTSVSDVASTTGCVNAYNSTNGVKASTTGNIYGIYDISGGSSERVSAYIDNGNSILNTNGLSIMNANSKYKEVYTKNTTDDNANNYLLAANKKGDSIWETSSNAISTQLGWYSDTTNMPSTARPWFIRTGDFAGGSQTGAFSLNNSSGNASSYHGFRPIIAVSKGL